MIVVVCQDFVASTSTQYGHSTASEIKKMPFKDKHFTQDDVAELIDGEMYRNCHFERLDLKHIALDGSTFAQCNFRMADLTNARFNGATLEDCDLSNARVAGANFFGVAFENTKLMGINFAESTVLTAARFKRCNLDYVCFRGVSLASLKFEGCSFVEADLSLTNLKKTALRDCDLTDVDFREAVFFQTDLRGSNLAGFSLRKYDPKGLIITPGQFAALAQALGMQVME